MLNLKLIKNSPQLYCNYSAKNVNVKLKSWKEIPGPKSFPIIKQAYCFIPRIGAISGKDNAFAMAKYFHENYGPIVRFDGVFGGNPTLFLFDPDAIEYIYRSEDSMPIRGNLASVEYFKKKHNKVEEEQRPTGLSTENGAKWKSLRSTVNPVMLQPAITKQYKPVLEQVATDMVQRLKSIRNDNNMIDGFDLEMKKWALESIGIMALGGRIGCFDPNLPKDSEAQQLIHYVTEMMLMIAELDTKPNMWKYFPTKSFKKGMQVYKKQYDLCKFFIDRAIKDLEISESKTNDEISVLKKLLKIDERVAILMTSDILGAGVDTPSMSIIGALYLLGKNRNIQHKLRAELESMKSSESKRPYLKACLKEAQRLMAVAPVNNRLTTKEYELLGYVIPKGVVVHFFHHYLSMLDEQYPRAQEFIPERWLVDKNDPMYYGNAHAFATTPFGFGSRICIGKRFADLEIEIFISKLIENFEVEWLGPPPKVKTTLVNYIQGPYNFVFKDV